jgi:hypothetical protein
MPCETIESQQDIVIEQLQQSIINSSEYLDPKMKTIWALVSYIKEQKKQFYTTKDEEWRAFYSGLHKITIQRKTPRSSRKRLNDKKRGTRRQRRRRQRIFGGNGNIRLYVIIILLCIVSLVESAIGTTAKSLTAEQIDKAFTGKSSLRSLYMQLALSNDSGFCHPLSQLATSPKSLDYTVGKWSATKTPDEIAKRLGSGFSKETEYDAAAIVKSQAHTSDYNLYDEPIVITGFSSWDEIKFKTDAMANIIYEHWRRNIGGRTGDTICLFRISVANVSNGSGHTFVGMVRMMSGELLHGFIDSNRFGNLVNNNSQWLYVDAGFFDRLELPRLGDSVVVSDNPLSSLLPTFYGMSYDDLGDIKFEFEDNSNKSNNSPVKPGSIFPVFGYTTSEYKNLRDAKIAATDAATKIANALSRESSIPTVINPFG